MTKDEALKLALEALENVTEDYVEGRQYKHNKAITAIKQALAAPVQEPVAVVGEDKYGPFVDWLGDKSSFYELNPVGTKFYTTPPAEQRKPLTDEQVNLFINGRGDEHDEDYVEATGDGYGLTDADLVKLVRRVEAAHGIKENT
jgi:hypothetical protein